MKSNDMCLRCSGLTTMNKASILWDQKTTCLDAHCDLEHSIIDINSNDPSGWPQPNRRLSHYCWTLNTAEPMLANNRSVTLHVYHRALKKDELAMTGASPSCDMDKAPELLVKTYADEPWKTCRWSLWNVSQRAPLLLALQIATRADLAAFVLTVAQMRLASCGGWTFYEHSKKTLSCPRAPVSSNGAGAAINMLNAQKATKWKRTHW